MILHAITVPSLHCTILLRLWPLIFVSGKGMARAWPRDASDAAAMSDAGMMALSLYIYIQPYVHTYIHT